MKILEKESDELYEIDRKFVKYIQLLKSKLPFVARLKPTIISTNVQHPWNRILKWPFLLRSIGIFLLQKITILLRNGKKNEFLLKINKF